MEDKTNNIRNFCIISHIDHGKSTLADRLLELTGTVEKRKMRAQFLDMMDLERERGITIKLQPVRMEYDYKNQKSKIKNQKFILNLIDTPGHVDFSYEVSRSLAAVEGAILLVDASQGIQAQTLANLSLAQKQGLVIIPAINKIDLAHAQVDKVVDEVSQLLKIKPEEIFRISAKEGTNIDKLLGAVIEKIPSPKGDVQAPLRALIFDSKYDSYQGIIAYVRIIDGQVKKGQRILMTGSKTEAEVLEAGVFQPELKPTGLLEAGQIGYLATGLKEIEKCRVGDTITDEAGWAKGVSPLPGYEEIEPMVFASFYPVSSDDFDLLKDALSKLKLNDASLSFVLESSPALGRGFRCGFLGLLHLEIVSERLSREYGLNLVITSPAVSYRFKESAGRAQSIEEPWIKLKIICHNQYLGKVMKLLSDLEGQYQTTDYLGPEKSLLIYRMPLREIMNSQSGQGPFYDQLKSVSSGFASMAYQLLGYQPADLVKLEVLVAGEKAEVFSRWVSRPRVYQEAKALVSKLKEVIPKHQFSIALQAMIDGRIIARETIKSLRKDVIAGLYGGDYTRKRKLLEKQKKGKKKMKQFGRVNIPQEAFLKILKK